MKLKLTPALTTFLQQAAGDQALPQELRAAAAQAVSPGSNGSAEWALLKNVSHSLRQARGADAVPPLEQLCRGSGIVFPQPRRMGSMPLELRRRLEELKARLEQQQYDAMVADVTQEEQRAAASREGGLMSYKQQISFGVHVLAMMAAFYAFGHVAGMALTSNKAVHPIMGLALMVLAMLLETVLYILRTTVPPKLHQAAARRAVAARVARQQQQQQQQPNALQAADALDDSSMEGAQAGGEGSVAAQAADASSGQAAAAKSAEEKKSD